MPRTRRFLAGLSLANGALAIATAVVFSSGGYGAFRPQDTGGFRQVDDLLVAYAAVAFAAFVAAADRRRWDVVPLLALVVAMGNVVFLLSPFYVPRTWHAASIALSIFVFLTAVSQELPSLRGWAAWLILLGSSIGGIALIGAGRYEAGPNEKELARAVMLTIAVAGLVAFALGAVLLMRDRLSAQTADR